MTTINDRWLAVDAATCTGWAVNTDTGVESGVVRFDVKRGESPGMRFYKFRIWLEGMVDTLRPIGIVYEQSFHRGGAATEVGVGLMTRIIEVAATKGIEHKAVPATTLKLHATGYGKADKDAMIDAAEESFPHFRGGGDNEADALHLLGYALAGFPEF